VLYRDGRMPFSAREQRELQAVVPLRLGAIKSARLLQRAEARAGVGRGARAPSPSGGGQPVDGDLGAEGEGRLLS